MGPSLLVAMLLLADAGSVDPKAAAAEQGRAAALTLKKSLKEALVTALKISPEAAIEVCAVQAPALAAKASTAQVVVGRSAVALRNPANAPRPWVAEAMKQLSVAPKDGESRVVELENGKVGYAETIVTQKMCLACHGTQIAAPVAKALKAKYPADRATGFKEGDFRGVVWAEISP